MTLSAQKSGDNYEEGHQEETGAEKGIRLGIASDLRAWD